ncbi:MAG: YcxB family protein [Ferruginibacter sp.]
MVKDDIKETKFQWNTFVKKQENAAYIFLYIYSTTALIIPKSVLRSEVEKEQLMKLLSQHISFDAEVGHLVKQ